MDQLDDLLETFPCDLCGQSKEEFLYTKRGVLTNYPFRVVRCRSCGLIYLNPRLGEEALMGLYDNNYYNGKGFDQHVNYIVDYDKERDIDKIFRPEEAVKCLKEIVPSSSLVLDFGCGLGDFMRQAIKQGYKVEGFEVSNFAAKYSRRSGFKVYDHLDQLPYERYDLVSAIEVLEHCSSPLKALSAIHRCLKPGGIFYYTTENFDNFYIKWRLGINNYLDRYIVPEGHIHFFSTKVMNSYFRKVGFSKIFHFETKTYRKNGRLFEYLSRFGLIENTDSPTTSLAKFSYYGARKAATILGLRRRPLPLARK